MISTMLQVVEAVDGGSPFYTCNEIRQRGRAASPPEQWALLARPR